MIKVCVRREMSIVAINITPQHCEFLWPQMSVGTLDYALY